VDLVDSGTGLPKLAYERLVRMIDGPEWADGGRLPAEMPLADGIGVSRRVLRLALSRLRDEGRITSRRGSGNYVVRRDPDTGPALDFGRLTISSVDHLSDCLRFRRAIEVAAAGEAALNADEADMRRLDVSIELFRRSLPGPERFDEDLKFHTAVSRASKNMFFLVTIEGLAPALRKAHRLSRQLREVPLNEAKRVADEHARVAEAIRAGDPDAARAAMTAHLDAGLMRLLEIRSNTSQRQKPKDSPDAR